MLTLTSEVQFLKGVGEARARILDGKGIRTVEDLLYYVPRRYQDRRHPKDIAELVPGETATVIAIVFSATLRRPRRGPSLFEVVLADGLRRLHCKWFNSEYLERILTAGQLLAVYGKVDRDSYSNALAMMHPDYEVLGDEDPAGSLEIGRIVPIYETAGYGQLSSRFFRKVIHQALERLPDLEDPLPAVVRERLALPARRAALFETHFPSDTDDLAALEAMRSPAQFRMIFEELFFLEVGLELKRARAKRAEGQSLPVTEAAREKIQRILPFHPTGAQKRVLSEIAEEMASPHPMNRLLQGDVGSGKTIVALQAAIVAIENGSQVAVMAPTEILAAQHALYFRRLVSPLGYQVAVLTSGFTPAEKQKIKRLVRQGLVQIVIGTHALLEEDVEFRNLGLVVVDEQHRFGVRQRLKLMRKGRWPDVLVMTATPIPRTLALTLFGDLEVSTLDEMPPGRKPIHTRHVREEGDARVYEFVRTHVRAGRQAYIVYPVVEESEKQDIKSAIAMHKRLREELFPEFRVGLLHGRMSSEDKEAVMEDFKAGRVQILVATTVIEVGVDVPNATVMVIEHAERFGLAQLHQLRGRVGRGAEQSFCILVSFGKLTEEARERISIMRETNDGFRIAETDLRLRGPGEFFGTKQSGMPAFRIADLLRDAEILELARREAHQFTSQPPSREELVELVNYVKEHWSRRYGLIQVG